MKIKRIDGQYLNYEQKREIGQFLYEHLDEFRDSLDEICHCLDYVTNDPKGGDVFLSMNENDELTGCVVLNKTGMGRYIPENILVYVAVDKKYRGQGVGKKLVAEALKNIEGSVALHVEPHNPAIHLYEKLGFTNKYLEMRYTRD